MVAQQHECASYHQTTYLQVVKIANASIMYLLPQLNRKSASGACCTRKGGNSLCCMGVPGRSGGLHNDLGSSISHTFPGAGSSPLHIPADTHPGWELGGGTGRLYTFSQGGWKLRIPSSPGLFWKEDSMGARPLGGSRPVLQAQLWLCDHSLLFPTTRLPLCYNRVTNSHGSR